MTNNKKILMLTRYGKKGASSRYRFYNFIPYFIDKDYRCDISPLLIDKYLTQRYENKPLWRLTLIFCYFKRIKEIYNVRNYDLVFIEKELFPYMPYWFESFVLRKVKYVLDYDDAIFHSYSDSSNIIVKFSLRNKIKKLMQGSELVISANAYLDNYALAAKAPRTIIINDNVNLELYERTKTSKYSQYTIVWIGSPSTAKYIEVIENALVRFCKEFSAKFIMIGGRYEVDGIDVEYLEWSSETEIKILKACHVGIMPLFNNGWERGKGGFKLIQYMASNLPVIASPVGINESMVLPGINGYLAESEDDWFEALVKTYNSSSEMGVAGNSIVKNKYNTGSAAKVLIDNIVPIISGQIESIDNIDSQLVSDFGVEWTKFNQKYLSESELKLIWQDYFSVFPWDLVSKSKSVGVDIGCGTGRWAQFVAPNVKKLYLLDPSNAALKIAKDKLKNHKNTEFYNTGVEALPFEDNFLDFAYSLGVLHHVPDINVAFSDISKKLKKGAPFLIYLYYSMENKPKWFVIIWKASDYIRRIIVKLPYSMRFIISQIIAFIVYLPIISIGRILKKLSIMPNHWPLEYYIDKNFYIIRNDALDRFATSLENRYSRSEIEKLFYNNGFRDVKFSDIEPFWCASGIKI